MRLFDIVLQVLFVQLTVLFGVGSFVKLLFTSSGRITRTCGTHYYSHRNWFDAVVGVYIPAARKYRSLSFLRQSLVLI